MIGRISRFMTRFVSRWLPDPLIFAMLLTLLTFVIALWLTPQTPISMVKMWGDGFWNLLAFGMQMALIIVTGHALASSAPVKSLLRTAASAAKTLVQGHAGYFLRFSRLCHQLGIWFGCRRNVCP